ncbi:Ig-like domain (group 3) [Granulicella rosea]|uniref:Ig-like domain (Group 3) n=1 Tax=Granulicella rosea TaxID=474952 RepID=A0A239K2C5_9BACT|nr:Ig-like domain repeat protein [Granulicella rosea]SNT12140.1 Ig-like domain (group 3) [Granulicella rosea]
MTVKKTFAIRATLLSIATLLGWIDTSRAVGQATASAQSALTGTYSNAASVAADPYGNLYVSDKGASTLYKYTGGNGSASTVVSALSAPEQLAVDASGNLWVANGNASVAYEYVTSQGKFNLNAPVTLGTGLGKVTGVAVDVSGNIYIVDNGNRQLVKETLSGTSYVQSTIVKGLTSPTQVAVDQAGNVYVADPGANAVIYLPSGSTTASMVGSGLSAPYGVAVDTANNVYIADTGNGRVVTVPYSTTTLAPDTGSQTVLSAGIASPTGISVDTRNAVYIANGSGVYRLSTGAIYLGLLQANSGSITIPVNLTFTSSLPAATASIKVVTAGKTGQDYQDAGGSTCAGGTTYVAGNSCTVNVTFAPIYPGARPGAIVFYDASNKVQLRVFLGGGGLGPVIAYETGGAATTQSGVLSSTISTKTPRGAKFDPFGNLFFADTGNGQIVQKSNSGAVTIAVASSGIQDVAINGAGDLIAVTTAATILYPYENGTWSTADAITVAATPARTINTDVAGNMWSCNYNLTGSANTYVNRFTLSGSTATAAQLHPGILGQCFSVAVDLFGNLGATDYTAKDAWYMPATGKAPYALGINASYPWAAAFDASGSLFMSDYGASATDPATSIIYRIPNEYGRITGGDMVKLNSGRPSFGFSIDPAGNIVSVERASGSSTVAYFLIPRAANSATFSATAVGGAASSLAVSIVNSGNQAPVYTQSSGILEYGDADDFPLNASLVTTPTISPCDFTSPVQPGLSCYFATNFIPTSPGATRTATVTVPSQATTRSTLTLTGTSSGTAPTTASKLALAIRSPTGNIYPTQAVSVAASAASDATGTVTLYVDGAAASAAKLAAGAVLFNLPSGLTAGSHTLSATYAGNAVYAPIESTTAVTLSVTVAKATPLLTISSPIAQAAVGQVVPFTGSVATQSGLATPTGTLTFYEGSANLGSATLSSGSAVFTISSLTAGTHTVTFTYGGDGIYSSATTTGSVSIVVGSYVQTSLALSLNPTVPTAGYSYGQTVVATASLSALAGTATPTGPVTFTLDGISQPVTLSAEVATFSFTSAPGSHILTAAYAGNANFGGSVQSRSFSTVPSTTQTSLNVSTLASYAGVPITLTATVTGNTVTATGSVTFYDGVANLGSVSLSGGTASLTLSTLPAGSNGLYAAYAGGTDFTASASPVTSVAIAINPTTSTVFSSPQVVYPGTTETITVTVGYTTPAGSSKVPSGNATLYLDGVSYAATSLSATGVGTFTVSGLASGIHQLTGSYVGDSYYSASATTANYPIYIAPASGWTGDYAVAAASNTLSIVTGSAASLPVTITPSGNYFGYVQLGCTGLPQNTACTFPTDQLFLNGSNTAATVQMKIYSTTPTTTSKLSTAGGLSRMCFPLAGPLLLILSVGYRRKNKSSFSALGGIRLFALLLLSLSALQTLTGCSSRPPIATAKGTYTVNVTATGSGSISHAYAVQMTFQ